MEYKVATIDDVPLTDLSEIENIPPDLNRRAVDEALGCRNLKVKIWYFKQDEEIQYHAHSEQEELFFVLNGEFSLKLGRSGEEEYVEVGEGTFWVAAPKIGHGHRCISGEGGAVLAIGAPAAEDPGLDPHSLSDEEIDKALAESDD